MMRRKDLENKKAEKRNLEELNDDKYMISVYGPAILFDYLENPYTLLYFVFKEGWNINHLNLMKIILKKLNKENFSIVATDDVAEIIRKELKYLLSAKIVVEYGIDNDKNIHFTKVYNYSFVDFVEDRGKVVYIKVNKDFYNMMDKYFDLDLYSM